MSQRCSTGPVSPPSRCVAILLAVVSASVLLVSCSNASAPEVAVDPSARPSLASTLGTVVLPGDAAPTALTSLDSNRLVIGDRTSGRIYAVDVTDPAAPGAPTVLARVDVTGQTKGQRGLIGLVMVDGALYASWTRASDGHLVVGQVSPGPQRVAWIGPKSANMANGGHLSRKGGRILIGIGDLLQPDRIDDPDATNGKLLSLDPTGQAEQEPTVLSGGWNNPFAFTVTGTGAVWVADNAPGGQPERLGRGDLDDADRFRFPGERAPSALIDLGSGRLGLCGYLDGDLVSVDLNPQPTLGATLSKGDCRTGATTLADDRVAVADGKTVHILALRR